VWLNHNQYSWYVRYHPIMFECPDEDSLVCVDDEYVDVSRTNLAAFLMKPYHWTSLLLRMLKKRSSIEDDEMDVAMNSLE